MKSLILSTFLASSLLAAASADAPPESTANTLRMTVRVYNYAKISDGVLRKAKRQSDRIFSGVGIETSWLDCPISPELIPLNRSCSARPGPEDLILKLLPKSMSKKYGFKTGIFGFALVPGHTINLFFARVLDLAYYGNVGADFRDAQAIILGHMIVHEIGHSLLGPNSHAASGVMDFPWDKRVLTNMERGRLKFTREEELKIRKELERRVG